MRFASLTSGSAANSTFVGTASTRILIDAGCSAKTLVERLGQINETLDSIDGIFITHAHGDHVKGLEVILKAAITRGRLIPVYVTRPTAERLEWKRLEHPPLKYFESGNCVEIGDLKVQSLTTPHDCYDPVAFTVTAASGEKVGVATDLGFIPPAMCAHFRSCGLVMVESNHDSVMLRDGDYPVDLKRRISGDTGHLSNGQVRNFIREHLGAGVRHLVLAHLSRENNHPQIVRAGAAETLARRGLDVNLVLATHAAATEVIVL